MPTPLRVVLWNAKGLSNHKLELQAFLDMHKMILPSFSKQTSHPEQSLKFLNTPYTTLHTLTILQLEVQQSYSGAQYAIRNYYPISLTKYRLQPSSLTPTHGP